MEVQTTTAQIDWLTIISETEPGERKLSCIATDELDRGRTEAIKVTKCNVGPYEGIRCGQMTYAFKKDAVLLSLAGNLAQKYIKSVLAIDDARVTRLDLAVDVTLSSPTRLADRGYLTLTGPNEAAKYRCRTSVLHSDDKGCTLYIGKRGGKKSLGRLYDKGIQSKLTETDGVMWRYEVQLGNAMAQPVFRAMGTEAWHDGSIYSYVFHWFLDRGVSPVYHPDLAKQNYQRDKDEGAGNVQKQLDWLLTSVRPCVTKLRLAGHTERVYNALGIGSIQTIIVQEDEQWQ